LWAFRQKTSYLPTFVLNSIFSIKQFLFMTAITCWAEEDRPREKMLLKGTQALSDAELLAIMIGSGTIGESAVVLAQRILASVENNLQELGRQSLRDLQKFKGIGEAKAITIAAALEIGRRRQLSDLRHRPRITGSRDAFNVIAPLLTDLYHEEFWLLLLNRANEVVARERLSTGGTSGTVVDIKMVLKTALDAHASGIIAVHNHPSGNLKPSAPDLELTQKIFQAGKMMDIPLLDHLIVSERGFYSFADEGTKPFG
jgi:DNA repair protein RadC